MADWFLPQPEYAWPDPPKAQSDAPPEPEPPATVHWFTPQPEYLWPADPEPGPQPAGAPAAEGVRAPAPEADTETLEAVTRVVAQLCEYLRNPAVGQGAAAAIAGALGHKGASPVGRHPDAKTAAAIELANRLSGEGYNWEVVQEVVRQEVGLRYEKGSLPRMLRRNRGGGGQNNLSAFVLLPQVSIIRHLDRVPSPRSGQDA